MSKVVYENGIHDISNNDYHSSHGISRSMLMDFKRSPKHYWYKHLSGLAEREEPSPAMNIGNAVHTLILEPHLFDEEFYVTHQKTKPRKGTEPHEKMLADAQGKIVLTRDEYLQCALMAKSVTEDENASQLLKDCAIEKSIYFTHKETGLQVKARPDAWLGSVVCDLKTTGDARPWKFQSSCANYGYFLQAAIIKEALASVGQEMEHFVCIPIEKEPPYCVGVYMFDAESIDFGLKQFNDLMIGVARCIEKDSWPSYGVQDITVPKYALFEESMEIE